ncbi:hypothetical protein STXM2123_1957 [Streptomyces sp. F-3]|nr:hypothetical protein STXM2123_1957 [Streptomyces sp. F-3]
MAAGTHPRARPPEGAFPACSVRRAPACAAHVRTRTPTSRRTSGAATRARAGTLGS